MIDTTKSALTVIFEKYYCNTTSFE